jgi:hypothetical protein
VSCFTLPPFSFVLENDSEVPYRRAHPFRLARKKVQIERFQRRESTVEERQQKFPGLLLLSLSSGLDRLQITSSFTAKERKKKRENSSGFFI